MINRFAISGLKRVRARFAKTTPLADHTDPLGSAGERDPCVNIPGGTLHQIPRS